MTIFNVSDDAYDRFMGRYSARLAPLFADFAGVEAGHRVVDVGAGTGALTTELVRRVGAESVAAAEPSAQFVATLQDRLPDVDVQAAPAEQLPWADASFDAALAQLVMTFVADAPAAAREMARVARPGATVAVCMWQDGELGLATPMRAARRAALPDAGPPPPQPYRTEAELTALLEGAGLVHLETALLEVESDYRDFDEFWEAALGAVGPDTGWLRDVDDAARDAGREAAQQALGSPTGAFTLHARARAVRATRA